MQFDRSTAEFAMLIVRLAGFAVVAFVVTGAAAAVHRWYFKERLGEGIAVLVGVSVVALYLNTTGLFGDVLGGRVPGLFAPETVAFNVVALGVAALAALPGRVAADRLTTDVFAVAGAKELDEDVGRLVRTVGRVTPVELPEEIDDMEGYDPVDEEVKARMAGKTLLFPKRLPPAELRDRLVTRLKDDYDVGYVDVDLTEDREVAYLALGSRMAGIGPTLVPGTCAVAVRADPANSASPGDVVQVWSTDGEPTRVATAELRGTAGDVATVALDEADAAKLDAATEYRLVTLPSEPQADREFASLLRAADETLGVVTVAADSPLTERTVGDLDVTVVAIRPEGGEIQALPGRSRTPAPGDTLYIVARPELLRRLESEAGTSVDVPAEN